MPLDLELTRCGDAWTLTPLTPRAGRWLRLELAAEFDAVLEVDLRCLDDLIALAQAEGLTVH